MRREIYTIDIHVPICCLKYLKRFLYLPFQSVHVGHSYTFEERDYEQRKVPTEAVKQHEHVTASSMCEGHRDRTTYQTNRTCVKYIHDYSHLQVVPLSIFFIIPLVPPVKISFLKLGKSFISTMLVTTPSKVPNWESIPNVNNMRKNSTDQN